MNKQRIKELLYISILRIKSAANSFLVLSRSNKIINYINNNPNAKKLISIVLLNLILLIIVFFLLSLSKLKPTIKTTPIPTPFRVSPTPTPTPVPLVQGPQTFSIGMKGIPEMYEVWFNTIDPKNGTQTVKLKIRDKLGKVNLATAAVKTDKLSKKYSLSFLSGTASDGVWTGSWTLNDTYNKNFMITFSTADNKGNKSSVDLTIR